jgi:ABC-type phosphate/phosphonate transport system substrate-binding protein
MNAPLPRIPPARKFVPQARTASDGMARPVPSLALRACEDLQRRGYRWPGLCLLGLVALPVLPIAVPAEQAGLEVLRIGASGTLTGQADSPKEKAGVKTLQRFIKEETGLQSEIFGEKNWLDLARQMARGELHVAMLQGYEFAWASAKYPDLKPLVIAVNREIYPMAHLLTRRNNSATEFVALQGASLAVPITSHGFLRLFVERQSEAAGKSGQTFFTRISTPDNVEDALDDVVDGKVKAVVIDQAALDAYKQRKPGRYKLLKEIARSRPFPPMVVAYYGSTLDPATLQRFKTGLLNAAGKKKGETLLTLSRLTGFEAIPEDFDRVLAETRKAYPPQQK